MENLLKKYPFELMGETTFKQGYYEQKMSVWVEHWSENTRNLSPELFKGEILNTKDFILKCRPKRILVNSQNFHFILTPDIQTWMSENLFPVYPIVGMERKAFIMPKDFFSMISVEQHVEEDKTNSFVFGFFDNANDAWQWLMQLPKKV